MTLPASGNISLTEITEEVFGVGVTGKSLVECGDAADPSVGSAPYSLTDFYSHTQEWGRLYVDSLISYTAYAKRETQGDYHQMVSGPSLEFTADRDENMAVYQDGDGSDTPIPSGDGITLKLYRRDKQSSDSWGLANEWNSYTSFAFGCAFTTYDYKLEISGDP